MVVCPAFSSTPIKPRTIYSGNSLSGGSLHATCVLRRVYVLIYSMFLEACRRDWDRRTFWKRELDLIGKPVHVLIRAVFRRAVHVATAQCMKSCGYWANRIASNIRMRAKVWSQGLTDSQMGWIDWAFAKLLIFTHNSVGSLHRWVRKITGKGQRRTVRLVRAADSKAMTTQITTLCNRGEQKSISGRTTCRTLRLLSYSSRKADQDSLLSAPINNLWKNCGFFFFFPPSFNLARFGAATGPPPRLVFDVGVNCSPWLQYLCALVMFIVWKLLKNVA